MSNNQALEKLEIIESKKFNSDGILITKYYVWFANDCIYSTDELLEAEKVYSNILNRKENPSRTSIKSAYVAI